jgi:hypothetical protein
MVAREDFAEVESQFVVKSLAIRVGTLQQVGVVLMVASAIGRAVCGRSQEHSVLSRVEREHLVDPFDLEESAGEAWLAIGDGGEGFPINRFEEAGVPAVQPLEVLSLRFSVGVLHGWAANVAELGGQSTGDSSAVDVELDDGSREKWNGKDWKRLILEMSGSDGVTPLIDLCLPWDRSSLLGGLLVAVDMLVGGFDAQLLNGVANLHIQIEVGDEIATRGRTRLSEESAGSAQSAAVVQ